MEHYLLGGTGVRVSPISLGTGTFGAGPLADDAVDLVHRALDLGVNFLDCANSYGNQSRFDRVGAPPAAERESAEEILGRALVGRRDEAVVTSKVMEPVGPGINDRGLSRRHIHQQVEESLRRLRTDYIDVYFAHHPDPDTALPETLRAFDDLVRAGKIRYWALSNYPAWQMVQVLWLCDRMGLNPPVCQQVPYNLVNRKIEAELVPACAEFDIPVAAYSPLASGLLAGRESRNRPVAGTRRFGGDGTWPAEQVAVADRAEALAETWGVAPSQVALAWLLLQPTVASVVIGSERPASLEAAVAAASLELDDAQRRELLAL